MSPPGGRCRRRRTPCATPTSLVSRSETPSRRLTPTKLGSWRWPRTSLHRRRARAEEVIFITAGSPSNFLASLLCKDDLHQPHRIHDQSFALPLVGEFSKLERINLSRYCVDPSEFIHRSPTQSATQPRPRRVKARQPLLARRSVVRPSTLHLPPEPEPRSAPWCTSPRAAIVRPHRCTSRDYHHHHAHHRWVLDGSSERSERDDPTIKRKRKTVEKR